MSSRLALLFPGQGAQAVGMGRDLAESGREIGELFERADALLGFPLSKWMFEGPESELRRTAVQQPALVLAGLAALRAVELQLGRPLEVMAAAGLSLGEYAALAAAGALSFEEAIRLVRKRGELMEAAAQRHPGGMAAILQLEEAKVRAACEQAARETGSVVAPCNFNGGGQIVIGGTKEALARAVELCQAAGARRAASLPVSGAFHTPLMQPAADGLRAALAGAALAPARFPVYANESARPVRTPAEVRESLYRQLTSPVLWERTIRNLAEAGATEFLEAGPGTSLSNLVKRILPEARVWNAGTWAEAGAFAGSRCAVDGKPGGG